MTEPRRGASFRPAPAVLCPVLIGRALERDLLATRLQDAIDGHGGVVGAIGEAGAGKTRLCQALVDAARAREAAVLTGRAVPTESPVPYRPLIEAFSAAFRDAPPHETPELVGFGGHIRRLLPSYTSTTTGGAEESTVLLGEAVVRLLRVVAGDRGCVLLLEDLHWADSETLAVVDYLADALRDEHVLMLFNARPTGLSDDLLQRLRRRDPSALLDIAPLDEDDVERVVGACLATDRPPRDVVAFISAHSEGNPFLIEELLAGLVASGALTNEGSAWTTSDLLKPAVPLSFGDSIHRRLAALDEGARRVIDAAAVLGRRFEWELLPGVADLDASAVVEGLRRGVDEQLIDVDGNDFTFRHALTREAVLAEQLPPVRQALAQRALPAVERAHPGLPGAWCEHAAELAEAAGDRAAAAAHLVVSARRALDAGAYVSAETTAYRARRLATDDLPLADAADEVLVEILQMSGKPQAALMIGRPLVERLERQGTSAERVIALRLVLARACIDTGDQPAAVAFVDPALASVAADAVDDATAARVEAIAAHVALDQVRLDDASALARSAIDRAAATGQVAVQCEALEVLGRVTRATDTKAGAELFREASEMAERHGLTGWMIRAEQELAWLDWRQGRGGPLSQVRDLALRNGALVSVAYMDLALADAALSAFDREDCLAAATRCVEASRRYGLAALPVAELWLAGAHALHGDEEQMEQAAARALERDPDDPRILGDLWGRVRATGAMVHEDRARLRECLDHQMTYARVAPVTTSIFPNRVHWAYVHTIDDDDHGRAARDELAAATNLRLWPYFDATLDALDAIALGREGQADEASERFDAAWRRLEEAPTARGSIEYANLLAAEAAVRDGWGDPATWARVAEAFFTDKGYDAIARACRTVLAAAGAPVPRRGRGESAVPASLRALGITSRELDVLRLVAEGLSNREIGERLYLSPRTVERHLGSLFDRTGIRNRSDLGQFLRDQSG